MKNIDLVVARYKEDIDWISNHNTYLVHIINFYDQLKDYTIFCQGKPFDHCRNFIKIILDQSSYTNNIYYLCDNLEKEGLQGNRGWQHPNGLPIAEWKQMLFPENKDTNVIFSPGAQYIVPKHKILQRPKDFYLALIAKLLYSQNPIEAYIYERLWPLVFN